MVRSRKAWAAAAGVLVLVAAAGFRFAQARPDAAAKAGEVTSFAKGPYLQALGAGAVTVKVELPAAAPAELSIFVAGEATPVATVRGEARDFHALRAEGLRPATAYEYELRAGAAQSGRVRFTTAPVDARPFRFLVYGDNRTDPAAHAAVVRAMGAARGDFLVNTGDLVHRGPSSSDWREFFSIEAPLLRDRCLFAAVGNHELYLGSHDGEVAFLRYFGGVDDGRDAARLYGSFRWGNSRFFVLNAMDNWTGDERAWLRAELDRSLTEPGLAHRIAVMHHGPFSAGRHGNNAALAKAGVVELMRERKVDLVLAGHDHDYERGSGAGLKYIVSGGGGAPLYGRDRVMAETLAFESAHHFVEVSIDGERVDIVARRATSEVIEACGFTGGGPWDCERGRGAAVEPGDPRPPAGTPLPARATAACGCATPGSAPAGSGAALALAALLALARRRR
jgi:MYXO-CTERM domain-containing protein